MNALAAIVGIAICATAVGILLYILGGGRSSAPARPVDDQPAPEVSDPLWAEFDRGGA